MDKIKLKYDSYRPLMYLEELQMVGRPIITTTRVVGTTAGVFGGEEKTRVAPFYRPKLETYNIYSAQAPMYRKMITQEARKVNTDIMHNGDIPGIRCQLSSIESIDATDADLFKVYRITNHIDMNNIIINGCGDYATVDDITEMIGYKHSSHCSSWLKKMHSAGVIAKVPKTSGYSVGAGAYILNPLYCMYGGTILAATWSLFRNVLVDIVSKDAKKDLDTICLYKESSQAFKIIKTASKKRIDAYREALKADPSIVKEEFYESYTKGLYTVSDEDIAKEAAEDFKKMFKFTVTENKMDIFIRTCLDNDPQYFWKQNNQMATVHSNIPEDIKEDVYVATQRIATTHRSQADVQTCRNIIIDLDAHFTDPILRDKVIKAYEQQVIPVLPEPTADVFSGNGHQIWYRLSEDISKEEYRKVEMDICSLMPAITDSTVKDCSRLFRCPGTINNRGNGYTAVKADLVSASGKTYSIDSIVHAFSSIKEELNKADKEISSMFPEQKVVRVNFSNNDNDREKTGAKASYNFCAAKVTPRIFDIMYGSTMTFAAVEKKMFRTSAEFYAYVKTIDIAEFTQSDLSSHTATSCIFPAHKDSNPSATVYHNNSGERYVCSCSEHGYDLIDTVVILQHCQYNAEAWASRDDAIHNKKYISQATEYIKHALNLEIEKAA